MVQEPQHATTAPPEGSHAWVGSSVPKIDSLEKAVGATKYVGDMQMPGMLHARILWARVPPRDHPGH